MYAIGFILPLAFALEVNLFLAAGIRYFLNLQFVSFTSSYFNGVNINLSNNKLKKNNALCAVTVLH